METNSWRDLLTNPLKSSSGGRNSSCFAHNERIAVELALEGEKESASDTQCQFRIEKISLR